jgi:hypothetical protein
MSDIVQLFLCEKIDFLIEDCCIHKNKEILDKVNCTWNTYSLLENNFLFNSPMCFLSRIEEIGSHAFLHVFFLDYKYYIAQRNGLSLGLVPVAVSGVLLSCFERNIYAVLAKRSQNVTQYPGAVEFIPSGGLNDHSLNSIGDLDPLRALKDEFEEEVGLSYDVIDDVEFMSVIKDIRDNVLDICYAMKTNVSPDIIKKHINCCAEYDDVVVLPAGNLYENLLADYCPNVVPTTLALAKIIDRFYGF